MQRKHKWGPVKILTPRPLLTNTLRSQILVSFINLYSSSKELNFPLYKPSFWDRKPIMAVDFIDAVLNRQPAFITILADPRGLKLNDNLLNFLLRIVRKGKGINIMESVLGGFDDRIRFIDGVVPVAMGDYILSDGKVLIHTIIDYLDRNLYSLEQGKVFVERSKHWTTPRTYKGHKVPEWVYSGNHRLIEKKLTDIDS